MLPAELFVYVLRHAAATESNWSQTTAVRALVCTAFRDAVRSLCLQHDDPNRTWLEIPGEVQKFRRQTEGLKWMRNEQKQSESIIYEELMTTIEASSYMNSTSSQSYNGFGFQCAAAWGDFLAQVFEVAWDAERDPWPPSKEPPPADWAATEQQHQPPSPKGFRLHMRVKAAHAAATLFEAEALRLLGGSFQAALHRVAVTQPDSLHPDSTVPEHAVVVGVSDVNLAMSLLGAPLAWRPTTPNETVRASLDNLSQSQLEQMVALLPAASAQRIVCRLAKRAGINRHTIRMVDAVWRELVLRLAIALVKVGHVLRHIAMSEATPSEPGAIDSDSDSDHEASEAAMLARWRASGVCAHNSVSEVREAAEEEEEEVEADSEGGGGDVKPHHRTGEFLLENADDEDARWDAWHREWVLLPSSSMIAQCYDSVMYGVREDPRYRY